MDGKSFLEGGGDGGPKTNGNNLAIFCKCSPLHNTFSIKFKLSYGCCLNNIKIYTHHHKGVLQIVNKKPFLFLWSFLEESSDVYPCGFSFLL